MTDERCNCWIADQGTVTKGGRTYPAGHVCNQPATHYIRIGTVVEAVCRTCADRDVASGAVRTTRAAYDDYMGSGDDD
jgi:hypothetical protein